MRNKVYAFRRFLLWFFTLGSTSGIVYTLSDCDNGPCEDTHDDDLDQNLDGICDEDDDDVDDYYEDY